MKKGIAILLALCLMLTGVAALAQDGATGTDSAAEAVEAAVDALDDVDAEPDAAVEAETDTEPDGEAEAETDAEPDADVGAETDAEPDGEADAESGAEGGEDAAEAEAGAFTLWFDEGFALDLPAGWVSYPVTEQDRQAGVRYILGDGAARYLYILAQPTAVRSAEALGDLIEASETLEKTANLMFADTPFVAFVDGAQDASGCATLWGGEIITFLFTPRSDSDYLSTVTELMETFRIL